MDHRLLTSDEIDILEANACTCDDWTRIRVADPFRPQHYRHATFSGDVTLGTTEEVPVSYTHLRAHET